MMTVARTKWLDLKIPTTYYNYSGNARKSRYDNLFIISKYYFNQMVEDVNDKISNASVDTNRKDPKLLYIKLWIED